MNDSILNSIKALLGPDSSYDVFDNDIILFINSALSTLCQLGVGPTQGFHITGPDETWQQFLGEPGRIESAKQYVFMKVKMVFDPPANSFVMSAMQDACKELEWRLNVAVDPGLYE